MQTQARCRKKENFPLSCTYVYICIFNVYTHLLLVPAFVLTLVFVLDCTCALHVGFFKNFTDVV